MKMKTATQFILSIGVTFALTDFMKEYFMVERPADALVQLSDYAFPSGHSSVAFAIATFLIYKISKSKISRKLKIIYYVIIFLTAAAVAEYRLLIKVHTIDQVIVGALLGIVVTVLAIKIVDFLWGKVR